jgi:hypothetical protein
MFGMGILVVGPVLLFLAVALLLVLLVGGLALILVFSYFLERLRRRKK